MTGRSRSSAADPHITDRRQEPARAHAVWVPLTAPEPPSSGTIPDAPVVTPTDDRPTATTLEVAVEIPVPPATAAVHTWAAATATTHSRASAAATATTWAAASAATNASASSAPAGAATTGAATTTAAASAAPAASRR